MRAAYLFPRFISIHLFLCAATNYIFYANYSYSDRMIVFVMQNPGARCFDTGCAELRTVYLEFDQ